MDKLTPTLNETQLRQNIDALQKGGLGNDKVQSYVNNYTLSPKGDYVLKQPTTQTKPAQEQSNFLHPLDSLSNTYNNSMNTAKEGVTSGVDTMSKGGIGNIVHGGAQAAFGATSGAVQATFAPFSASADAIVPGHNFLSDTAKGAVVGGELGSVIPGAGTLAGAGIGALFGGGIHVVNSVKDAILAHTNISDADKAMINNIINTGLAVIGEKVGNSKSGGEGLDTPVSEIPSTLKENISEVPGQIKEGVSAVKERISPTEPTDSIVGKVLQGKPEDIKSGKAALSDLDTSKVKSYSDLTKVSSDKISELSKEQDKLLESDKTPRKIQQLAVNVKGTTEYHNYVKDALIQLKEYYTKINDVANQKKVEQYMNDLDPTKGKGITIKDVNDIARMHGSDLNGYNANGELASGLSKKAAENTRQGLKQTVRENGPEGSQGLDERISNLYTVRDLSKDMAEKVNTLNQRIQKPNILQKVGGLVGKAGKITGIGDLFSKLLGIDKVPGSKTLDPVELQSKLPSLLKKINAALEKDDAGFIKDIQDMVQSSKNDATNPMKNKATTPNTKTAASGGDSAKRIRNSSKNAI